MSLTNASEPENKMFSPSTQPATGAGSMLVPVKASPGTHRQSPLTNRFSKATRQRVTTSKTRPFSIRLTDGERQALKRAAGAKPVGAFVREQLLDAAAQRKGSRRPSADTAILGQILGTLGRSGLTSGLADLGCSARLGTIVITPEMEAQIQAACVDIQLVKRMLFRGLGLAEGRSRDPER